MPLRLLSIEHEKEAVQDSGVSVDWIMRLYIT